MANDKSLELQIKIATEEALKAVASLKDEVEALAKEAQSFESGGGEQLERSFKEAETAAKDTAQSIGDIKSALGRLAEVAVAAKALSVIGDMGAAALRTADTFQTARNEFGLLLGDMEAGAGLFNELQSFRSPFDIDTLKYATGMLINAQVPLQDLQGELTKFGDLAMGNAQRFSGFVGAFSRAAARGAADIRVLTTFADAGVPIFDTLARNLNVTTREIVEMSNKGKIGFEDFTRALNELTAEGGQYFGGMELASQSLAAMQLNLRESVDALSASFGEMLLPAATAVLGAITTLVDTMNEIPAVKGLVVGGLVVLAGYLSLMAVRATAAFAAQMKLNLAFGVKNPKILAATIAVGALAAGLAAYSANSQRAAREAENLAFEQRIQNDIMRDGANAVNAFAAALRNMTDVELDRNFGLIRSEIAAIEEMLGVLQENYSRAVENGAAGRAAVLAELIAANKESLESMLRHLSAAESELGDRRTNWIDSMFGDTQAARIQKLNEQLAIAFGYLSAPNISTTEYSQLQEIIRTLTADLERLTGSNRINELASRWRDAWADTWNRFHAEQSIDPFAVIELERGKRLADAWNNYIRTANQATIDQINEYYDAQRSEVIKRLAYEEERLLRELSGSRAEALRHELREALTAINILEAQRVYAAAGSEAEIQAIRERFATMRTNTELQFQIKIDKTELEEAREAIRDWQQELSDSLLRLTLDIEGFSTEIGVVLSDLISELAALSASAALSGFKEFGRALGEGEDAAESMRRALAAMAQQILQQLPMMFLQAGLQLIANGQWPLGLGFIAAAGSSAIMAGYVDGRATRHATGGVFDEYGQAARAFAAGGAFTNQIVSEPTYFRYGGALGLMGEAGPEAIMPLTRMPNGNLGVETSGTGTQVVVNIINNSGAEVRREETTDGEGNTQIDVIIGSAINSHISSGRADRAMSRYGLRAQGV